MATVLNNAQNGLGVSADQMPDADLSDAPGLLEDLARRAESAGASDVHLQMLGCRALVSLRLDGVLREFSEIPEPLAERVVGRIKYLARLKTYQELLPQDGRIDKADLGTRNDVRVATYPTVTGEKLVLRLFDQQAVRSLPELGLSNDALAELQSVLTRDAGLLLLTGPAGSGKTTTIYASLRWLAEAGGRHIITVEDPVEQIVPGVMQTEVCEARGLTFAKAARHLLRQDPQVLVVGEIRDEETAGVAVRAALTGHLVISTLHAGSCKGVFERLLLMCPDHYAATSCVELVLNQRLIRRNCPDCDGTGCNACLGSGYRGRVPAVEWFRVTDDARRRLRAQGPDAVKPQRTLEAAARQLVQDGLTSEAEYRRVFGL